MGFVKILCRHDWHLYEVIESNDYSFGEPPMPSTVAYFMCKKCGKTKYKKIANSHVKQSYLNAMKETK